MFNPYIIILALFSVAGIATVIVGLLNIRKARKCALWPEVEGRIESYIAATESADMQAYVTLSYLVAGNTYSTNLPLSASLSRKLEPLQAGKAVNLQYQPDRPENMIFSNAQSNSEWLVIAAGVGATLFGFFAIVYNL